MSSLLDRAIDDVSALIRALDVAFERCTPVAGAVIVARFANGRVFDHVVAAMPGRRVAVVGGRLKVPDALRPAPANVLSELPQDWCGTLAMVIDVEPVTDREPFMPPDIPPSKVLSALVSGGVYVHRTRLTTDAGFKRLSEHGPFAVSVKAPDHPRASSCHA